jgi:hypothetical protein
LDFLNPQFVDSLGKIGGLAALLILSLAFIYLLIINSKSNSKSSDNQTAIINQTAVMQASYNELFGRMVSMMGEMQVGARKRDEQINKINESFANGVVATNEQNKILNEQTVFLKQLKEETTSGHEFTKQLVASVVDGSKDTSAAVQSFDKRLSEGFKSLPADVAHALDDSFKAIRDDIAKLTDPDLATKVVEQLRPDVVAMFDKALAKCLEENAAMARELDCADTAIDDTKQRLEEAERAKVVGVIAPAPMEPKPGEENVA